MSVVPLAAVPVLAVLYADAARPLRWPTLRGALFLGGALVAGICALMPGRPLPIRSAADVLLVAVAAPLIVASAPLMLVLRRLPRRRRRGVTALLHRRPVALATAPPVRLLVGVAAIWSVAAAPAWSPVPGRAAQAVALLVAGLLVWSPALAPPPGARLRGAARAAYLAAGAVSVELIAVPLLLSGEPAAAAAAAVAGAPAGLAAAWWAWWLATSDAPPRGAHDAVVTEAPA